MAVRKVWDICWIFVKKEQERRIRIPPSRIFHQNFSIVYCQTELIRHTCLDMARKLACACDPQSYDGGSFCSWQVSLCHIGLRKRGRTKQHPSPPGPSCLKADQHLTWVFLSCVQKHFLGSFSLLYLELSIINLYPKRIKTEMLFKGTVPRQSSAFCLISPITRPQSLWNLK